MRKTKAMLEADNKYLRTLLSGWQETAAIKEKEIKQLKELIKHYQRMQINVEAGFQSCATLADSLSHAIRFQMNANGVR